MEQSYLLDELVAALRLIPRAVVQLRATEIAFSFASRIDALIDFEIDSKRLLLVVETKNSAFPRDVRQMVWQLREYTNPISNKSGPRPVPLLVAPQISPGAREILREEGVGYFDASGSLYVPAPDLFIYIEKPAPKSVKRSVGSLFTGRRALVLYAAWECGEHWFGVHEIADRARVSAATVSETMIAMERHEWAVSRGAGPAKERRLTNRRALLDAWTESQLQKRPAPMDRYYVAEPRIDELMHRLDRICARNDVEYAITGEAAAQIHAPFLSNVSHVRCRMLFSSMIPEVIRQLGAMPVSEGWNLGIMQSHVVGELSFRAHVNEIWVADPLQVYLDLLQSGGRSREFAEHLRRERLAVL